MMRHFISFFNTAFRITRSSLNSSSQSLYLRFCWPFFVLEDSISVYAFFFYKINSSSNSSLGLTGGHNLYLSSKLYSLLCCYSVIVLFDSSWPILFLSILCYYCLYKSLPIVIVKLNLFKNKKSRFYFKLPDEKVLKNE
jgi:hypothetical protein